MKKESPKRQNQEVKGIKTMGPVENLEQHLHPQWWNKIFNSMYLKTDADVVEDERITSEEVRLFSEILGIEENDTLLDLACGQGRHLIELAKKGNYNLNGLDRSRYLVQRAKNPEQIKEL